MTNALVVREINFNDDTLLAVQDENGEIYAGVSYICNGIGFSKSQKDTQIQNVQKDEVLKRGCLKFQAGVFDPNNETVALMLIFIPLWLAKISITPAMKKNNPILVEKLIDYQIKARDVLVAAFLPKELLSNQYNTVIYNINENQRILAADQTRLNDKITNHIDSYLSDKEISDNISLKIGYEIEELKRDVAQEIKDRTSYIPVKPIVAKRTNTVNRARFKVLDKYTNNLRDHKTAEDFISRINIIADEIMKWSISKIKDEAERTYNFIAGDNAFTHEICVYAYTYYKGLKTA